MSQAPCPTCGLMMHAVSARARTGYLLQLDQCPRCGGLWFDRWELFPLAASEVARLEEVNRQALWALVPDVKRELKCPRCRRLLERFRDPLLPEDSRIERCRACDGLWLNRGELHRFKATRGVPRQDALPQPPLSDGAIRQVANHYGEAAKWATVKQLDHATTDTPAEPEKEQMSGAMLVGVGWLIARWLLRLLLGA